LGVFVRAAIESTPHRARVVEHAIRYACPNAMRSQIVTPSGNGVRPTALFLMNSPGKHDGGVRNFVLEAASLMR
jgi:hypothetical protein